MPYEFMVSSNLIALDFETYSPVDIRRHGLARYVEHPHFQPLLAGTYVHDQGTYPNERSYSLFDNDLSVRQQLEETIGDRTIVAFNAGFEQATLEKMGLVYPSERFVDASVTARAHGASNTLEQAVKQLLAFGTKAEEGAHLIRTFSVPGPYQKASKSTRFDSLIVDANPKDWTLFHQYCINDARLALRIVNRFEPLDHPRYQALTMDMNRIGWPVDLALVEEMQQRYEENKAEAISDFQAATDQTDLNLRSNPQLQKWCRERGIVARSFDEQHVESLLRSIRKRFTGPTQLKPDQVQAYQEVETLLRTLQILGGSSLKKLETIKRTISSDGRLRNQYMHLGAGATFRTTGRGVQMQNLPRLPPVPSDVSTLTEDSFLHWDNGLLASNIRQVFTSEKPDGRLFVADFSSIESRGLAWFANAKWKLLGYKDGVDLYITQAADIYGVPPYEVTHAQRLTGKVGELSCGYGAGGGAVQSFAKKFGVEMNLDEAEQLVHKWRHTNPEIVALWESLDRLLHTAMNSAIGSTSSLQLSVGQLSITSLLTPESLRKMNPSVRRLIIKFENTAEDFEFTRVIQGAHMVGRNIHYYKCSDKKSGDPWKKHFTDPKTKRLKPYTLYGGKLSGLLTQSLCREIFFQTMLKVHDWCEGAEGVSLIGQFHDELIVDDVMNLPSTKDVLKRLMVTNDKVPGLPLAVSIKSDYRYIK